MPQGYFHEWVTGENEIESLSILQSIQLQRLAREFQLHKLWCRHVQRWGLGELGGGRRATAPPPGARALGASACALCASGSSADPSLPGRDLEGALVSGAIALLDLAWLVELASCGGVLRRRQARRAPVDGAARG